MSERFRTRSRWASVSRNARTVFAPPMVSSSCCCCAPTASRWSAYSGFARGTYQRTVHSWIGTATSAASRNRQSSTASAPSVSTTVSTERPSSGSACRTPSATTETSFVTRAVRSPEPARSSCSSGSPSARSTKRSRSSARIVSPSRATSDTPIAVATAWPSATSTRPDDGRDQLARRLARRDEVDDAAEQGSGEQADRGRGDEHRERGRRRGPSTGRSARRRRRGSGGRRPRGGVRGS